MKIRAGFVSNSSSSSFIIGLVNIGSEEATCSSKFVAANINWSAGVWQEPGYWVLPPRVKCNDWNMVRVNPLEDGESYELSCDSFMGVTVSTVAKDGDNIVLLNATGPSDDCDFWDKDAEYYDYDKIDISDFPEEAQEVYEFIESRGGQVAYGAGRDG